jgi:hypothetical protein
MLIWLASVQKFLVQSPKSVTKSNDIGKFSVSRPANSPRFNVGSNRVPIENVDAVKRSIIRIAKSKCALYCNSFGGHPIRIGFPLREVFRRML